MLFSGCCTNMWCNALQGCRKIHSANNIFRRLTLANFKPRKYSLLLLFNYNCKVFLGSGRPNSCSDAYIFENSFNLTDLQVIANDAKKNIPTVAIYILHTWTGCFRHFPGRGPYVSDCRSHRSSAFHCWVVCGNAVWLREGNCWAAPVYLCQCEGWRTMV